MAASPPIGLFALKSPLPEAPLATIFRGVTPLIADSSRVSVLVAIPVISLFLPDLMTTKR